MPEAAGGGGTGSADVEGAASLAGGVDVGAVAGVMAVGVVTDGWAATEVLARGADADTHPATAFVRPLATSSVCPVSWRCR